MNVIRKCVDRIKTVLQDGEERNLLKHIMAAFLVKGLAMCISFFSMPLYIKYFGNDEVLGLWYTILSTLAWIQICDLGLGNGLRNKLTEALAENDFAKAKQYISSTYMALVVIIVPIIALIILLVQFVDLNEFFNISPELISASILRKSVSILLCSVAISFVLKLINRIIYAIQKSSYTNILALITSTLPLIYVFIFHGNTMEGNLISLTIVHALAINLPYLAATLLLFSKEPLCHVKPAIKSCNIQTAKSMLGLGIQFFLAQIFFMFLTSTNEIIISRVYSASAVVHYSIYNRLFTIVGSLFTLALTPLWSKITKDFILKKYKKIQKTCRVLYEISGVAALTQFVLCAVSQILINIWLGDEAIDVNYQTALIFAFYGSIFILNVVLTTLANAIGDLKTQILFYGIFSILKIPVISVLSNWIPEWHIVMLYNGCSLLVFCFFQFFWVKKRLVSLSAT